MLRSLVAIRTNRLNLSSHADAWSRFSLKELKAECKNRGLKVSGKKIELVQRLTDMNKTSNGYNQRSHVGRPKFSRKKSESIALEARHKSTSSKAELYKSAVLKSNHTRIMPPKTPSNPAINDFAIKNQSVEHRENLPINHIQYPSIEHVQKVPVDRNTKKLLSRKIEDSTSSTQAKVNRTPMDQDVYSRDSLSRRDKLFLLTSNTCIIIWWWWPYTPAFIDQILKSCKYLKSFF